MTASPPVVTLSAAYGALGRRHGWLLHFNAAKQSKTRVARIERATPLILERFGTHD